MSNIQEVFNRIQEKKNERKKIKATYSDALANSVEYQKITEEIKILKEKKKSIEDAVKSDFNSEFSELERIKTDLEGENILLSDAALNCIAKGELIEITDEQQNKYEPVFSVRFRKM